MLYMHQPKKICAICISRRKYARYASAEENMRDIHQPKKICAIGDGRWGTRIGIKRDPYLCLSSRMRDLCLYPLVRSDPVSLNTTERCRACLTRVPPATSNSSYILRLMRIHCRQAAMSRKEGESPINFVASGQTSHPLAPLPRPVGTPWRHAMASGNSRDPAGSADVACRPSTGSRATEMCAMMFDCVLLV